jgi:hypothetical protein
METKKKAPKPMGKRQVPRGYPVIKLPVFDVDQPHKEGYVQDLSVKGLRVAGLTAEAGQKKTFIVQADRLWEIRPFSFDVECIWSKPESEYGLPLSGYEIINVSDRDRVELETVINNLSLSDEDLG